MAHHKKLADEAYANDFVIHQNACEDRKLKKQLDHLERMQERQRRRFEQEEHYFQTLHKVVPAGQQGDGPQYRLKSGDRKTRPKATKRLTYPIATGHSLLQQIEANAKSTPNLRRRVLNLKDIAVDKPQLHPIESPNLAGYVIKHQQESREHAHAKKFVHKEPHEILRACRIAWVKSPEANLKVEGTETHLCERGLAPHRNCATAHRALSSKTKCSQFINSNERYLHEITVESASSTSEEERNGKREPDDSASSVNSNRTDIGSTSDVEERLPDIFKEKVGMRVSVAIQPSFEMRMLYQMKNGKLDVPPTNTKKNAEFSYSMDGEIVKFEELSTSKGKIRKSLSLDSKCVPSQTNAAFWHHDMPTVNGSHMTLVKFLPKNKQALYLKYGDVQNRKLSSSWHAGESGY